MYRLSLFFLALALTSTFAIAQAVVTPSGYVTIGGAAVPTAPTASPLLVRTPVISLNDAPTTPSLHLGNNPADDVVKGVPAMTVLPAQLGDDATRRHSLGLGVNSQGVTIDNGTDGRSLGELARENRARKSPNARCLYSNEDGFVTGCAGGGSIVPPTGVSAAGQSTGGLRQ